MATLPPRHHVVTVTDPRPGSVVGLSPGSRLSLRLRTGLGPSRWYLAGHPGNLLPVVREGCELSFLAFEGEPGTLRLERRHPRSDVVREVCEVRIVVSEVRELAGSARRSA